MKLPGWPWLVAAGLVGLALGFVLFRGHPADPVIIAAADSTLAQTKPEQARRDTITRRITRIVADTARLRAAEQAASDAEARSDSALQALVAAQSAAESLPPLLAAFRAQVERGAALSVAVADLRVRFDSLAGADSLYRVAAESRIGTLETTLATTVKELKRAKIQGPCSVGTVSGGWSPVTGKADLVLGGSCRVWPLLKAVF